jgi:hypothetical protein
MGYCRKEACHGDYLGRCSPCTSFNGIFAQHSISWPTACSAISDGQRKSPILPSVRCNFTAPVRTWHWAPWQWPVTMLSRSLSDGVENLEIASSINEVLKEASSTLLCKFHRTVPV